MIWSVSTLLRRNGSPVPVCRTNFSMSGLLRGGGRQVRGRGQPTGDGGGRGHQWRDEVRAAALALPAFEVAVRGGGAALTGLELVGVHAQAHGAARAAPLPAGLLEHHIETLGLCL